MVNFNIGYGKVNLINMKLLNLQKRNIFYGNMIKNIIKQC